MLTHKKVVLLFSGGMDSTALLWQLLAYQNKVLCVNVNYQQRHYEREAKAATRLVKEANTFFGGGVELMTLTVNYNGVLSNNALTNMAVTVPSAEYTKDSLSGTVVPGRNATLLAMAFGVAYVKAFNVVATAVHGGDHAIYNDCRPAFIDSMKEVFAAMTDGEDVNIDLYTPFLYMTKNDIATSGLLYHAPLPLSYSCYNGGDEHCGECATCRERETALEYAKFALYKMGKL